MSQKPKDTILIHGDAAVGVGSLDVTVPISVTTSKVKQPTSCDALKEFSVSVSKPG